MLLGGGHQKRCGAENEYTQSLYTNPHTLSNNTHTLEGAPLGLPNAPGRDRTHTHGENEPKTHTYTLSNQNLEEQNHLYFSEI